MTGSKYGDVLERLEAQVGGMVEVWVEETSFRDWTAAVHALEAAGYRVEFTRSGEAVQGPLGHAMFTDEGGEDDDGCEMYVDIGSGRWWTELFSESLIDFQGRPEWITSDRELDEVVAFMEVLADATGKEVIFIPETLRSEGVRRYLTCDPQN